MEGGLDDGLASRIRDPAMGLIGEVDQDQMREGGPIGGGGCCR